MTRVISFPRNISNAKCFPSEHRQLLVSIKPFLIHREFYWKRNSLNIVKCLEWHLLVIKAMLVLKNSINSVWTYFLKLNIQLGQRHLVFLLLRYRYIKPIIVKTTYSLSENTTISPLVQTAAKTSVIMAFIMQIYFFCKKRVLVSVEILFQKYWEKR